jgi:hypothetical protein
LLAALALQGCIFSSHGGGDGASRGSGHYVFYNPTAFSNLSLDSTYQVSWSVADSGSADGVRLSVYKGDDFVGNLGSFLGSARTYVWSLPATRIVGGYRLGSGAGYRLRITDLLDSSKWDFSPSFSIYSSYTGSLALTAPEKGARAKLDSSFRITWTATGNVGSSVGLQLYKDTVLAYTLTTSAFASAGAYTWASLSSPLGSGEDYHIRIFAYADPSISQTGPAFAISSPWSGSFAFKSPGSGDTLKAGATAKAAWTVSGNPGPSMQLTLWNADSVQEPGFAYGVPASADSVFWAPPVGLSSGRYRLRLSSSSDAGLYAFSPYFYVKGSDPDTYEKDDSLSLAKAIDTDGKPQQHTLTALDVDWLRFKTKAGKRYLVNLRTGPTGSIYVYVDVLDSAGRSLQQGGTAEPIDLAPRYAGSYYLRVWASSANAAPGPYQISVFEYDSSGAPVQASFSAPDGKTTWAAGSAYTVSWSPDSLVFGPTVTLALYNDSVFVQYLTSYQPNTGAFSWTLPAGLYTGSKYRIRMSSYSSSGLFAYSPYFTISGATPDAYEPDNSRGTAKAISADGAAQQRNIMPGDTDWVSFDGVAGQTYLASVNAGSVYVYLYVLDSAGTLLTSQSGSRISLSYAPTRSGKYFLRVQGSSGGGPYALSLLAYDPAKGGLPVKFAAPDSGTVWSAGSSYGIAWTPDSATFGSYVNLELYNDTVLAQAVATYLPNSGSYGWLIQSGTYTSGRYRLRVSSYSNRAIYGFSPYFTISGMAPDAYEPDNLRGAAKAIEANGAAQQRNIVYGDTDWVRFDGVAGKTYLAAVNSPSAAVSLNITDSLGYSLVYQTGSRVSVSYAPPRSGKYYVRVQYYSGSGAYSLSLAAFDAGQGVPVKFTVPDTGTVWSAGSSYTATWIPDSTLFGTYVSLGLYQGSMLRYSFPTSAPNSGSAYLAIPAGLPTGSDYRLRMANYSNSSIYGSSAPFTISGVGPDSLEPNDSIGAAKTIVPNSPRLPLSLSYLDKDWFRFTAKAQKLYAIQAASSSSVPTLLRLWPAGGGTPLLSSTRSTLDTLNNLAWVAPADGDYFISVEGVSGYYGTYRFEVKELDPSAYKFAVSAPAAGAAFKAGGYVSIEWSDPSSVKGYVDLFLYDADGVVQTIGANVPNGGTYSWTVPAGLAARSDYSVKVISRMSSAISGVSGAFSIGP